MRQSIVLYAGKVDGRDTFTSTFTTPPRQTGERNASEAQRLSLGRFFDTTLPPDLGEEQAHALLSYRDYGRACADKMFPLLHSRRAAQASLAFASFVSSEPEMARATLQWMVDQFDDPESDPDDLPSRLDRSPYWPAMQGFAAALVADMSEEGVRYGAED